MNLLLLARGETDATGIVRLTGRRARELLRLPDLGAGRVLHAGVIDGPLGAAEVLEVDADAGTVTLGCRFAAEAPPRPEDTLLLAVPHPRTLLRCVEHAAALGFGRLVLLRTWRVAKSHLLASALDPATLRRRLVAGLEQARRTHLPEVVVEPRFRPFVEDRLDALVPPANRFVAHPDAPLELAALPAPSRAPLTLAIGPERGFTPYEVDALGARGFRAIRSGAHPLRVETALAVVHGQLTLLRARGVPTAAGPE